MKKVKKEDRKFQIPSFKGLSEEELSRLYSVAQIRRLQAEEVLIKEGDTDQTVYVVLDGELRIVKDLFGAEQVLATLGKDNWIGEIAFTRKVPRTASAIVNKPSTVMVIEKAALDALGEKTQLFFYKRLNELAFERIRSLDARESDLARKNKRLKENLFSGRMQHKIDYGSSDMIRGIIKRVPKLPAFASTLAVKLLEEGISTTEVVEGVKGDPSLVAIVLKTVNSPYYGFQGKISDINHAVVLLGFNELHQLIVAEGVRRTMPDTLTFRELHAHSGAISIISFALSQVSGSGKPSQVATIGLLHDLGQGVIQLLKEQNANLAVLVDGLDHSQMGSLLLKEWNLPEVVWQSVYFQRYPEFSPPSSLPPAVVMHVAILYLAHLCYGSLQGRPEEEMPTAFLDEYMGLFKWEKLSLGDVVRKEILPALARKAETFPAPFRELLMKHIQAGETAEKGLPKGKTTAPQH